MEANINDPLFTAIMRGDFEETKRLKEQGAVLSDKVRSVLSVSRELDYNDYEALNINHAYVNTFKDPKKFIKTIRTLHDEIGEPLFFNTLLWSYIKRMMFEDDVWECVLDCFDPKINKAQTMREIIDANRPDILEVCAKHGWLSQAKKRDEMIKYATDSKRPECTAWLLEFKKNNFDLAAEREKADKKAERELNAAPDSVTALKQIWSYKKREDGSIIITGYKGDRTEIAVPERIGKNTVTAIGGSAFCPFAPKITQAIKQVRKAITKITLPETVSFIESGAFWACGELVSVNIPDGVKIIDGSTFAECLKLEKIIIPNSVKCIERRAFFKCESLRFIEVPEGVELINEAAFALCKELMAIVLPSSLKQISSLNIISYTDKLTGAVVPRESYAEKYCKNHSIPFSDKLVEVEPGSPAEEYCKTHGKPYIYKEDKPR